MPTTSQNGHVPGESVANTKKAASDPTLAASGHEAFENHETA